MRNGEYILVVAPKDYPGKKYRGRYCYEHILVYWQNTGELPKDGEIIHHIDGNKHNNIFSNLRKMSTEEHTMKHAEGKKRTMVRLRCPVCGILFTREKRQTHLGGKPSSVTCCCRKCSGRYASIPYATRLELQKKNVISIFAI